MDTPNSSALAGRKERNRTAAGARRYRSKAERPCDLCRARKVLCNIPDPTKPCQLCDRTSRPCTFTVGTSKQQRIKTTGSARQEVVDPETAEFGTAHETDHDAYSATFTSNQFLGSSVDFLPSLGQLFTNSESGASLDTQWQDAVSHLHNGLNSEASATMAGLPDMHIPELWTSNNLDSSLANMESPATRSSAAASISSPMASGEGSLNPASNMSSSLIGYSNESDPFLLEHYPYNASDELDFFMVRYRRPAQHSPSPGWPPVHFLQSKIQAVSEGQEAITNCLTINDNRNLLDELVGAETRIALLRLYMRFIFQNLPIVSISETVEDENEFLNSTSPGVLAGIFALALPFTAWDEALCMSNAYSKPDEQKLWQIAYSCLQKELHFPSLTTVQTAVLLLNTTTFDPVAVESPFAWSLACSTLGIAQSLGLHVEPSDWKISQTEIKLRRRLWWTVVVEHSWRAITHGRAPMLREDDCNVLPISRNDFSCGPSTYLDCDKAADYFMSLCSLTGIANGVCRRFFTLRAVSMEPTLQDTVEKARESRIQLNRWLEELPQSLRVGPTPEDDTDEAPDSRASLHIAYFTIHVLVFRALLRPIVRSSHFSEEQFAAEQVLGGCRDLMKTLVLFVRGMDLKYVSSFWPAYTRHCLCYPGLFCYLVCFQKAQPHLVANDRELLATWRNVLRARVRSWPLLRFAIVKVDAIYWKKLSHTGSDRH